MPAKATIVGVLGEKDLLVPELVHEALAANGRAKYLLTLLQLARSHADAVDTTVPDLREERELVGIADARYDEVIGGSRRGRDEEYRVPLAKTIVGQLFADVDAMMEPLRAATPKRFDEADRNAFERRLAHLRSAGATQGENAITGRAVVALTSSDRERRDSVHLLVLDAHKAIDRLAASLATDHVDGAKVYGLDATDRPLVAAFMGGVHETEALKFGHPGLGTTATRSGSKLILENDIGETSAHVLIVHVEGLRAVVTSTDVHLQRLEFLRKMLEGHRVEWADLRSRSARELQSIGLFYECVGTFDARDGQELEGFLRHLGSRLVFLIDWNRARKALRAFVPKATSLELLDWAARENLGHRGLLEMGGERLVFDAMAAVLRTPLYFGERLADVLGPEAAADFLRFAIRTCSVGLQQGRSHALIASEVRAELSHAVRAGGERLLDPIVRHAAIAADMAKSLRDQLRALGRPGLDQAEAAQVAKLREDRADELVVLVRDAVERMPGTEDYRQMVEAADDAADGIEEAAFLLSLFPQDLPAAFRTAPLDEPGDLIVATTEAYVACVGSARRAGPETVSGDLNEMLDSADAIVALERRMDDAERRVTAWLTREASIEGKLFALTLRMCGLIELAVDALTHAALVLRDRLTTRLSR